MIQITLDNLKHHLHKLGIEVDLQPETGQLCGVFTVQEESFPFFIRVYDEQELVQLVVFFQTTIKHQALSDTARLLHILNKEIDMPGLSMDEDSSTLFYRLMIPAKNKKIDLHILEAYLNVLKVVCPLFSPLIHMVATGSMTLHAILNKAKGRGLSSLSSIDRSIG